MRIQIRYVVAALWLVAGAVACSGDDDTSGGLTGGDGVTAIFELPGGQDFYDTPFPNNLRLRADGTVDLSGHTSDDNAFLQGWISLFSSKTHGFGLNQAVYFRFSGALDVSSLPADAAASTADGASVYLVDIDPASPEHGKKMPIRRRFEPNAGHFIGANWLAILPFPGFPLRPSTTYAVVVTTRVKAGGEAVGPSATFAKVLTGTEAKTVYAPLLTWLNLPGGDELRDVASAAVFTTGDPVSLMGKLRDEIRRPCGTGEQFPACIPPPAAREVVRTGGAAYDTFVGKYDTPLFQTGDIPYTAAGGEILLDESGDAIPQQMQALRFALTVPNGGMPDHGWPIVVFAHGTGGSYRSFINNGVAAGMAAEGIAVISIDQVLHGPRDPTASNPEITFFNVLNPVAARDNVRQGAADDYTLVRLVETLTVNEDAFVHRFDGDNIYFMGHSQGGLTGPLFLPFEPKVKAAILSGAGGLIYLALLYKQSPESPNIPELVHSIIRDEPLDEFNPMFSLVQMFIDPADPVNYGRLLGPEPVAGVPRKDIFQSEGFNDTYAPIQGIEAFGISMSLSPVSPLQAQVPGFAMRGLPVLDPPVAGNAGGRTAVFLQYKAPAGEDGHFVIFDVAAAQRQSARFLGTLARTGTATLEK